MPFSLLIDEGPLAGRRYVFDKDEVSFGRTEENDVVVPNEAASRRHARMRKLSAGYSIEDLRSANGTRVNDEPLLRPLVLEEGDIIEIARVRFRFSPYDQANLTRLIKTDEVPQWEKSRMRVPARPVLPASKVSLGLASLKRRFKALSTGLQAAVVLSLATIAVTGFKAMLGGASSAGANRPQLVADRVKLSSSRDPHWYGEGPGVNRLAPRGVVFSFDFSEPSPGQSLLSLHAIVNNVQQDAQVEVLLNDQHAAFLPQTFDDQRPLELIFERAKLKPNAENTVTLNPKGSDLSWRVSGLWIEQQSLPSGSAEDLQRKAVEEFNLGEEKLKAENVAARNLYDAWLYYKKARLVLSAIPRPPESLRGLVVERLREVENRLDRRCGQMIFTAQAARIMHGPAKEREVEETILDYFPEPDQACHDKATRLLQGQP